MSRFSILFSKDDEKILNELSQDESKATAVRKAIRLYSILKKEAKKTGGVAILDKDGNVSKTIILII